MSAEIQSPINWGNKLGGWGGGGDMWEIWRKFLKLSLSRGYNVMYKSIDENSQHALFAPPPPYYYDTESTQNAKKGNFGSYPYRTFTRKRLQ